MFAKLEDKRSIGKMMGINRRKSLMKLQKIEKTEYRKKMNVLLITLVASLALIAIGSSSMLISLFGFTESVSGESTGNFHLNVIGVIIAIAVNVCAIKVFKNHPYLKEALYVWDLKQIHNRIYRKLKRIKREAESGNRDALTVLFFYYTTQKQVYELDNNTLTINSVETALEKLVEEALRWEFDLNIADFDKSLIDKL